MFRGDRVNFFAIIMIAMFLSMVMIPCIGAVEVVNEEGPTLPSVVEKASKTDLNVSTLAGPVQATLTTTLPSIPQYPQAIAASGKVTLTWYPPVDNGGLQVSYNVYWSTSFSGPYVLLENTANTHIVHSGLTNDQTYYYKISAVNALGLESTQTTATSIMVVFAIADIYIYPNPLVVTAGAALTFASLSGNETIRIYTISGELVLSTTPSSGTTWNWNAKNTAGKLVARGVYIYLITRPNGEKRVGKVAVIG